VHTESKRNVSIVIMRGGEPGRQCSASNDSGCVKRVWSGRPATAAAPPEQKGFCYGGGGSRASLSRLSVATEVRLSGRGSVPAWRSRRRSLHPSPFEGEGLMQAVQPPRGCGGRSRSTTSGRGPLARLAGACCRCRSSTTGCGLGQRRTAGGREGMGQRARRWKRSGRDEENACV
jgi:hypothetical protein